MLGTGVYVPSDIVPRSSKVGGLENARRLSIQLNVSLGKKWQVAAPLLIGAAQNISNCTAKHFNVKKF